MHDDDNICKIAKLLIKVHGRILVCWVKDNQALPYLPMLKCRYEFWRLYSWTSYDARNGRCHEGRRKVVRNAAVAVLRSNFDSTTTT